MSQPSIPTRPSLELNPDTIDELFPEPSPISLSPVTPAQPQEPQPAPPVAPQPQPTEEFLQGETTVYRTREAAIQGINEKDKLINQLRQQYSLATGVDPISKQPVGVSPQESNNYVQNPAKYVEDLKKASSPEQLAAVQNKFVYDSMAPVAPAISSIARSQAVRQLESELPDFSTFYNSANYKNTLATLPSLREAVEAAEGDVRFSGRLPELYRIAYLADKGVQLPSLLKAQTPPSPSTPTRPTTNQPTTPTPIEGAKPSDLTLNSSKGRKAIIAEYENRMRDKTLPWA